MLGPIRCTLNSSEGLGAEPFDPHARNHHLLPMGPSSVDFCVAGNYNISLCASDGLSACRASYYFGSRLLARDSWYRGAYDNCDALVFIICTVEGGTWNGSHDVFPVNTSEVNVDVPQPPNRVCVGSRIINDKLRSLWMHPLSLSLP